MNNLLQLSKNTYFAGAKKISLRLLMAFLYLGVTSILSAVCFFYKNHNILSVSKGKVEAV